MNARCFAAVVCSLLLSGCYLSDLAGRQLSLLNEQQPLPRAIADERDPERLALLRMVPALRSFGRDRMQLPVGHSYAGYYATEQTGIAFVLVGSEKTRLREYSWWFPIVGRVAYKSFVDEASAREEQRELEAAGYDSWVGRVTAYSTLGLLRDPVTTVMMRKGIVSFVEVLLHEMAHMRLYAPGHTDWDEQLASFCGRVGAEQYLRSRHADDAALMAELEQHASRRVRLDHAVRVALAQAQALYRSGRPTAELLARRQVIFARLSAVLAQLDPEADAAELSVNNARLLQYRRYLAGSEQFERMWVQARRGWPEFWRLVEQRAARF
jgi:predicted aminopeptidase